MLRITDLSRDQIANGIFTLLTAQPNIEMQGIDMSEPLPSSLVANLSQLLAEAERRYGTSTL